MGIDIITISRARLVRGGHSPEICDEEEHWYTGDNRQRMDRKTPGCYISDGKSTGFAVNYFGYTEWRYTLCWLMLGVDAETVWENPRRFAGQPFIELIDSSDAGNYSFGPVTSAKLAGDFAKYAVEAKRGFMAIAEACRQHQKVRQKASKHKKAQKNKQENISDDVLAGGLLSGSTDWRWNWGLYQDFQKGFQIASDGGFLIVG
jgi:hypothetical protein